MRHLKWAVVFCMTLAFAAAAGAQVFDQAGIFSQEAVDRANTRIDGIHRRTGYDLRVETYTAMPADIRAAWEAAGKNEDVLKSWALSRANATSLRGMILLITMDPKHVRGDIGTSGALTTALRDRVVADVTSELRAKRNDGALTKAVDEFDGAIGSRGTPRSGGGGSTAVQAPQPAGAVNTPPSRAPSGSFSFGSIICVGVAVLLIVVVVRALLGARRNAGWSGGSGAVGGGGYSPGGYPPGGYGPQRSYGGGFMGSMLGGLLGGAAGSAAYDYFSRDRHGSSSSGQDASQISGPTQPDYSSDFRDANSSASDPGGGGDFGSSDSSSSFDSGGGGFDSGGGGGDSGGGGDF